MSRNPVYAFGTRLDAILPYYGVVREEGEDDATVRAMISASMSARGAGSCDAIAEAVRKCEYVQDVKVYENDTDSTDAKGIPAHSLAVVIESGIGSQVAKAIMDLKAPGVGTYGSTHENIQDEGGNTQSIYFSRTTTSRLNMYMTIRRLPGCDDSAVTAAVRNAVFKYINNQLKVAESLVVARLYAVAYNVTPELAGTYAIQDIYGNIEGESTYVRDEIACPWNSKLSILSSGGLTITFNS